MMRFSTFAYLAVSIASLCTALPKDLTNFLLVTTAQENPSSANTSDMKAVSATSLFVCLAFALIVHQLVADK
jgi:hypothetical protein